MAKKTASTKIIEDPKRYAEPAPKPTQLDRIETLLVELVESNRKLHPDISGLLNSGFQSNFKKKGNS